MSPRRQRERQKGNGLSKQQLYDVQHALIVVHFFTVIPRLGREIAKLDVLSTT